METVQCDITREPNKVCVVMPLNFLMQEDRINTKEFCMSVFTDKNMQLLKIEFIKGKKKE
jgi:hypothetical protein